MSRWAGLFLVMLGFVATPARADDCYRIKADANLYGDVLGDRVVGKTTKRVIAWDGLGQANEPTLEVTFVALKGSAVQEQVVARVRVGDATAVACPRRRGGYAGNEIVELSWPDASDAGQATRARIAARRKQASPRFGRACFASSIPGLDATVCTPFPEPSEPQCVALEPHTRVFARPSTAAPLGVATETVVGEIVARVDDEMTAVRVRDADGSQFVYVRGAELHGVQCPPRHPGAVLGVRPPTEALLPDGTDAGYRSMGGTTVVTKVVRARGRTLNCVDDTPVQGLELHVCFAEPRAAAK